MSKNAKTSSLGKTAVGQRLAVILASAFLTTEGDSDPGDGGAAGGAGDAGAGDGGGAGDGSGAGDGGTGDDGGTGGTADDLTTLFTPEEIEARKAESERRAGLTEDQRAEEDRLKAEEAAKNAPPEEYADFTVADGITLDSEMITEFKPLAKELGLNQENAQKLVDLAVKVQQRTMDGIFAAHEERKAGWLKEAQEDPEIGADVKKWDPAVEGSAKDSVAVRAFNSIAQENPKLRAAVDELGIGNHPEFLRMFYRIGLRMREDGFEMGGSGNGDGSAASTLWPNLK